MKRGLQAVDHEESPQPAKRRTQFGLKELAPGVNPDVDIVAIHGIDGDRESSWTADNGVLWLKDLLPEEIPNARILTYGYDANTHGQEQLATECMHDHAMTFISKLALLREETSTNNRAIIFVAHSSGGILLKSALIHSHLSHDGHLKHHHAICLSTYGIAFFSTPHLGSATAELARFLLDAGSSSMPTSSILLRHIERDSEILQQQLLQYSAISAHYETKFFYELYDTPVTSRVSKRVVPKSSAVVPGAVNAESIGLYKDHVTMVKYRSADDDDFRTVATTLLLMAKVAHKKVMEKGNRYKGPECDMRTPTEIDLTPSQERALSNMPRVKEARFNADSRSSCLEGTRVDLLKTIIEWTEQKASGESRRIFWLYGQAGTGKTTISLTVAGDCQAKHCLGATFFFARDHAERSDLQLVFPTLAHQLGIFYKPFRRPLAKVIEEDPDLPHMDPGYQFRKLIVDPLKSCDSFPTSAIVVIDALDECRDRDPISKILSILSAHIDELPQLKFFITSRPEVHIREGFQPLSIRTQTFILHDIEALIVNADIDHYLRHQFSIAQLRYPEMVTPDWPPDESIKSLVRKSGKLFIFAATAMNFILDRNYADPPGQLAILLGQSPAVETSSSLFTLLDQLYLQVLRQAFPSGTTPLPRLDLLRTILGAVVHLHNPLSPGALEILLGIQTGRVRNTLRCLHSVIAIPDTDEHHMRLIHPSFFDFITTRCSDADFRINSLICDEYLAIRCFKQMNGLKRNICEIEDESKLNNEIEDLEERIEQYISPAMQYACLHWAFHLCVDGKALQGILKEFFHGKVLYWIEALSLLGYLREGISDLKDVSKRLITFSSPCEDLLEALNDSTQFIVDVFALISSASLQLYRSALPLAPPSSFLRETFHHELDGGMRVLRGEWVQRSSGVTILRGSNNNVSSVGVSPDGALIVSSSGDEVKIWDRGTGTLLETLIAESRNPRDPQPAISWVGFVPVPGGNRVMAVTIRFTLFTWDVDAEPSTINLQPVYPGERSIYSTVCTVSPDFTSIAGSRDNFIYIWSTSNGNLLKTLRGHSESVWSIAFSPDHTLFASGSDDGTICIWNIVNGVALRYLVGHSKRIYAIAFSPDSKYVVSGFGSDICLWDTSSGAALKTLKGHTRSIRSVAFSSDGTRVISGSFDNTLRVWSAIGGDLLNTISCPCCVQNVGFLSDGKQYISSSDDAIYVWDANRAFDLGYTNDVVDLSWLDVTFSPGGTYIYSYPSLFGPHNQHLWDGLTGTHLFPFESTIDPSISPNDKYLACFPRGFGRDLCLWDISSGTSLWNKPIDRYCYDGESDDNSDDGSVISDACDYSSITFSSDSTRIMLSLDDGLQIWDVSSGNRLFTKKTKPYPPAAFSHDGSQIIIGDRSYDLPPHVRPHAILSVDEPLEQIKYFMSYEWIFASKGTEKERCVWIPPDWYPTHSQCSFSDARVAFTSRRGLVLLDLSSIRLAI